MWNPPGEAGDGLRGDTSSAMLVRGMRIRSPQGTTFLGRYRKGPNGLGLVIRRKILDAELLNSARARGVRVMEGTEVVGGGFATTGTAVIRIRATGAAAVTQIEAKRVIVADGRRSFLARELGFLEKSAPQPGKRRYAIRVHCEGVSELSEFAEMQVGLGGYCGVAPLSTTAANICYVLFTDRLDVTPQTIDADFRRHLSRFPEIARRCEGSRRLGEISVVGPLRLISKKHFSGPFIGCGDTTGFLDPFTGEGIAHAIACGVLGAEAVRRSLGGATGAFLEYEAQVRALRRVKTMAALLLYGLVSRPALANAAASAFARLPRLADSIVQLFGDQV
jgi:flavin-dependent dehydrogenase